MDDEETHRFPPWLDHYERDHFGGLITVTLEKDDVFDGYYITTTLNLIFWRIELTTDEYHPEYANS